MYNKIQQITIFVIYQAYIKHNRHSVKKAAMIFFFFEIIINEFVVLLVFFQLFNEIC